MSVETVSKPPLRWNRFCFWGMLVEFLLILGSFTLPESRLAVEVRNFTLVIHYPLLLLLGTGFGETLPYCGRDLSMVILLPWQDRCAQKENRQDTSDLEHELTPESLRAWLSTLDRADLHTTSVRLPRFTTAPSFKLVDNLKSLGMASAFCDAANFFGIDGTPNFYLSDVFHRAFAEVNETGTEATAMTFVMSASKSMDDLFIVDHPFVFLIRDNGSGSILFLGRILDPTK